MVLKVENVIVDFDGTVTDLFKGKDPFEKKYVELLADTIGASVDELRPIFEEIKKQVYWDPSKGWENNGYIVAPASADPLLLNTTVGFSEFLLKLRNGDVDLKFDSDKIPSEEEQEGVGYKLFRESYPYLETHFREGAKEFLDTLIENYNVKIVTNSGTEEVEKKLEELGDYDKKIEVIGNAEKYKPAPDFDELPEYVNLPGFSRKVFMRRKAYYKVLEQLEEKEGFKDHNTAVVGDIFELDLALPEYLGYRVILLKTEGTQYHELVYFEDNSQTDRFLAESLDHVLTLIRMEFRFFD